MSTLSERVLAACAVYPGARLYGLRDTALMALGILSSVMLKYPTIGIHRDDMRPDDERIVVEPKGLTPFAIKRGINWYVVSGEYELPVPAPDLDRVFALEQFLYCPVMEHYLKNRPWAGKLFDTIRGYIPEGTLNQIQEVSSFYRKCSAYDPHYHYDDTKNWSHSNENHRLITQEAKRNPIIAKMKADFKIPDHR